MLETLPFEALLRNHWPREGSIFAFNTAGRAQMAREFALGNPQAQVDCWIPDSHFLELAIADADVPNNLRFTSDGDWPERKYDGCCLAIRRRESSEWNRELIQTAFQRMEIGGRLIIAVDAPEHDALEHEMRGWPSQIRVHRYEAGIVFTICKREPLKRVRNFEAEVVFRDRENLIHLFTRPGVFGHRNLDAGARQILKAVEVQPGWRLADLGCGSGSIGLALAARDKTCRAILIDSHSRAIKCAQRSAIRNEISNVDFFQTHDPAKLEIPPLDLVLANPPYYSHFSIAERFLNGAVQILKANARLLLVTKLPQWYLENATRWLDEVELWPSGNYHLMSGVKRMAD